MRRDAAPELPDMSSPTSRSRQVLIRNAMGLHARPAAMFVQIASRHDDCEVVVARVEDGGGGDDELVNGKSIMGLMMLAAGQGTTLEIRVSGSRADLLLQELVDLIERRFGEE